MNVIAFDKLKHFNYSNNNNKEGFYMAQNLKELRALNMKTRKTISKTRTAMSWEKLD